MKTITKELFRSLSTITALTVLSVGVATAQNTLQFTGVKATDEQAIRLTWASVSNEVYEIDEADALIDTNTGSITWNKLYDNYPSQGTNTFWLDTGNYNLVPPILHPKNMPMRFYRIVDEGPDDLISDEPTVSIVSPTNGALVSGELTITVAANTDQPELLTKLYVDGEEMPLADGQTNYVSNSTNYSTVTYSINTCEWGNGAHTLFATVENFSAPGGGPIGSPAALVGHAVSQFVPVVFGNLVTRISFSQPFFNPDAGQTQQVSAVFAANSDWTLTIQDIYSNAVRTVTGSGTSMQFNWDGNGDGGTNLPAGVYYYYINAQTNGLAPQDLSNGDNLSGLSSASLASSPTEMLAMPADGSGAVVPFALYPPGFDTNNLIIFEGSLSDFEPQTTSVSVAESLNAMNSGGFASQDASAPSSQNSPASPQRPPTAPMDKVAGTFGIAYQTYSAASVYQPNLPPNEPGTGFITIEGHGTGDPPKYHSLKNADYEALLFGSEMEKGGWSPALTKPNDKLQISDLRGSGTPFNQVNIGFLLIHGASGDTMDFTVGGCKQMYFPIASGTSAQYLRMSEMNFGGAGTNGLKWMAIVACRSLYQQNWNSMQSQNVTPYNSNLHLLLGGDTDIDTEQNLGLYWAKYMLFGSTSGGGPMTVRAAWYQAGKDAYKETGEVYATSPMKFAVAGDSNCQNDYLQTNYPPTGSWFYDTPVQVYPPQ